MSAKPIRFARDEEYTEATLDLLKRSVKCRLRANGKIATELSGGLDSSLVTALAVCSLRESGGEQAFGGSYSMVFPDLPCDESLYIDTLSERLGISTHKMLPLIEPQSIIDSAKLHLDMPDYPNGQCHATLYERMWAEGVRCYLSGVGGDELFCPPLANDWRGVTRRRVKKLASLILGREWEALINTIVQNGGVVRRKRRSLQSLIEESSLESRKDPAVGAGPTPAHSGHRMESFRLRERAGARIGVENRDPLFDRRLVEFALLIPMTQHTLGGEPKSCLRRVASGCLPSLIAERRTKAEFSYLFAEFITATSDLEVDVFADAPNGPVFDRARFEEMRAILVESYTAGQREYLDSIWPLFFACAVQIWYATLKGHDPVGVCDGLEHI